MMAEGVSHRAIARLTGASKNTITNLLEDAGQAFSEYQDQAVPGPDLQPDQTPGGRLRSAPTTSLAACSEVVDGGPSPTMTATVAFSTVEAQRMTTRDSSFSFVPSACFA
jgi:hypothetical protein